MPRGVKAPMNYEEQIKLIDRKLEKHAQSITNLKTRRQALLVKKQQQTMSDLQTYMEKHNLGADDVISRLQGVTASAESKEKKV